MKVKRLLCAILSFAMVLGTFQLPAFADEVKTWKDGNYTGTATVEPDEDAEFTAYGITTNVTVTDGVISDVTVEFGDDCDEGNDAYINKAINGTKSKKSIPSQIKENNGTDNIDAVSGATCLSNAIVEAVGAALLDAEIPEPVYVLMNIPYGEFYAAEGDGQVDAMTSATLNKTRNGDLAGGSYHVNSDGTDITGVTYPVKVSDPAMLKGLKEVTDTDSVSITVSGKQGDTTTVYSGKDTLFENESYAYYVLDEEPVYFKELSVDGGVFSFGKATGLTETRTVSAELSTGSKTKYGDYQLDLENVTDGTVYGVVLHTQEGNDYGLRHVENIWKKQKLAWSIGHTTASHNCPLSYDNFIGIDGQTITSATYYTSEGILEVTLEEAVYIPKFFELEANAADEKTVAFTGIPEDIKDAKATISYMGEDGQVVLAKDAEIVENQVTITEGELQEDIEYTAAVSGSNYVEATTSFTYTAPVYVLMNIPYSDFYAAEGDDQVDAMTSATKTKTHSTTLAEGSYHVNADGTDITGTTYPVKVASLDLLEGKKQVTDEDNGKDALFENENYAYYVLSEAPAYYKELTVTDGTFSFGKATGTTIEKTASAQLLTGAATKYGDYQLNIGENADGATDPIKDEIDGSTVYGVVLHTKEGDSYGLRHVENIWKKVKLGWSVGHTTTSKNCPLSYNNFLGMEGQTVTSITYYTSEGILEITLKEAAELPTLYDLEAEAEDEFTVALTGIPEDAEFPRATISYKDGEGKTAPTVYVADDALVEDGKVTTNVELEEGITYTVNVSTANYATAGATFNYVKPAYVLMNIPYEKFYTGEGVDGVDAVSTATIKTYNQTMAAGSYHEGYIAPENIKDAKILGVTYPVKVKDPSVLEKLTKVTDEDTAEISVAAGKSAVGTKEVSGVDLLFASGDYAYYVLAEEPNNYKTLTVSGEEFTFSAIENEAEKGEGMEAEVTYNGHYTDIVLEVSADEITNAAALNAIVLKDSDGNAYAMRHVQDVWKKIELGWNWDSLDGKGLAGKTVESVTYYYKDADGAYQVKTYTINAKIKLNAGDVTAAFDDINTITLTGLPKDIQNAKATVATKVGRGETATVIAEDVAIKDGKIALTKAADYVTTYTISIVSDNYADISTEATSPEEEKEPEVVAVTSISLTPASETIKVNDKLTLKATVKPDNATDKTVTWKSSDERIATVDANGVVTALRNGTVTITATTKDGGKTATSTIKILFTDVPETGEYYSAAVYWAADLGITKGYLLEADKATGMYGKFGPKLDCTRAHVVTFLWRMAGSPEPKTNTMKFGDVKKNTYYYKAVLWAAENGITKGYKEDNTFRPDATCLREHVVTFLYRYAGSPVPSATKAKFTDVKSSDYYYKAVQWAAETKITNGYRDDNWTTFRPKANCLREHVVTFLWRYETKVKK